MEPLDREPFDRLVQANLVDSNVPFTCTAPLNATREEGAEAGTNAVPC